MFIERVTIEGKSAIITNIPARQKSMISLGLPALNFFLGSIKFSIFRLFTHIHMGTVALGATPHLHNSPADTESTCKMRGSSQAEPTIFLFF